MAEAVLELDRFRLAAGLLAQVSRRPAPAAPARLDALPDEGLSADDRFVTALAALVWNVDATEGRLAPGRIQELVLEIDRRIAVQLDEILHDPTFQGAEAAWRSLDELVRTTNFRANVTIDFLDASKEEV